VTSQALACLLLRQPFQPFRFVISDHVEVGVGSPEQVKHKTGDRIASVIDRGYEWIIDLNLGYEVIAQVQKQLKEEAEAWEKARKKKTKP